MTDPAAPYRAFAQAAGTSPLDAHVATALGRSAAALRVLQVVPARRRGPVPVLAALHDLTLAGRAPGLAAAHAAADGEATAAAAVDTLLRSAPEVAALLARRRPASLVTGHCAVLQPAVAEAASRAGAGAVGLIGLDLSPGLDLHVDRVGTHLDTGQHLGDPASPVQLRASVVGPGRVPERAVPAVVARIGVGRDPLDLTDPDDARWLHACLAPDRPAESARLAEALAVAAAAPPHLLRGDPLDLLPAAVARVPAGALPVVLTTWAVARLTPDRRLRLRRTLEEVAAGRAVAWVSVEGVGVAPGVPTLGDRPASGHSTIGLTLPDGPVLRGEALGRCWSRGRLLSWLAAG
ncbi:DUF2332 domain-containing protein [Modestobacter sp. SSW1-42]|uniref:DUF2332 domain-containing protein n=1 Tax=Modestobacter sp. SSW1-42 TaxID=596372 RepID=UPI0039867428